MKSLTILDCTLRDGSYAIDFQFTHSDTTKFVAALSMAGLRYIEIGHGVGLGASTAGHGVAAETDERYLQAAVHAAGRAKVGKFFIPNIGRKEDLKRARELGMHFVRIGSNPTDAEAAREYIEYARELGLEVFHNFMKSYAVEPDLLASLAAESARWGSQTVAIVDSAGFMLTHEVVSYVGAVRDAVGPDIGVGFHAHNNLQLAVANSIAAVQAGANVVDATLRGMGRDAGNAQMEVLLVALHRLGYETGCDVFQTLDVAQALVPLMRSRQLGLDPLEVVTGMSGFHSSFMPLIKRAVANHPGIDIRKLIVEVCKVDRVNPDAAVVNHVAGILATGKKKVRLSTENPSERAA